MDKVIVSEYQTTTGTLTTDEPGTRMLVRTETTTKPVAYPLSKSVRYYDANGELISVETINQGAPVTGVLHPH